MSYILHLETATRICSVALAENDKLIAIKETAVANSHSSVITLFVEEVLKIAKIKFQNLDAICVSKGPGSYTGLRIGVSTAKGYCYALNIPLITVNTLHSMAKVFTFEHFAQLSGDAILCPMIDARRMEVYSALFNYNAEFIKDTAAEIIDNNSFSEILTKNKVHFFGDGAEKCRQSLSHNVNALFHEHFEISAKGMISLAWQKYQAKQFEDVAYFEPFYLKDFIATIPKKLL
ncbi:MAG: tRNA (adenosine(37)-N6)-threonylcarbamoyltransferase complex dimerization subunit type 1 TsaB [Bacteroidetes bacterium]|nr:tRNA (adenosine(37)-N6)-threonylcarbamoyltransferase complex dimerization subunit type 1 TsaB [Bacteroidota bacterium]